MFDRSSSECFLFCHSPFVCQSPYPRSAHCHRKANMLIQHDALDTCSSGPSQRCRVSIIVVLRSSFFPIFFQCRAENGNGKFRNELEKFKTWRKKKTVCTTYCLLNLRKSEKKKKVSKMQIWGKKKERRKMENVWTMFVDRPYDAQQVCPT